MLFLEDADISTFIVNIEKCFPSLPVFISALKFDRLFFISAPFHLDGYRFVSTLSP